MLRNPIFWIVVGWIITEAVAITWLVWDRRQQRIRDREKLVHDGELYHAVRNLLAAIKGRFDIDEVKRDMAAKEIKSELKEVPKKTADEIKDKVVEAIKADIESKLESSDQKIPTLPKNTGGPT